MQKKKFSNNVKKYYKVRDHCHYTGRYRDTSHNACNVRYQTLRAIRLVFHDGSNMNIILYRKS